MVLLSRSSTMHDTRPIAAAFPQGFSNGFQGKSTSHGISNECQNKFPSRDIFNGLQRKSAPSIPNGFTGESTSDVTIQKQRSECGTPEQLDYTNHYKMHPSSKRPVIPEDYTQMVTSDIRRCVLQRSCSENANPTPDKAQGQSYKVSNIQMFQRMDKPVVQKSNSESCLRTRRYGHYTNNYAKSLQAANHDELLCEENVGPKNKITTTLLPCSMIDSSYNKITENLRHFSSDPHKVDMRETSVFRHELLKRQPFHSSTTDGHVIEKVPTVKTCSSDMPEMTFSTPVRIYDELGILKHSTDYARILTANDELNNLKKTCTSGIGNVCLHHETGATSVHSSSSSGFPDRHTLSSGNLRNDQIDICPHRETFRASSMHNGSVSIFLDRETISCTNVSNASSGVFPDCETINYTNVHVGSSSVIPDRETISYNSVNNGSSGVFPNRETISYTSVNNGSSGVFPDRETINYTSVNNGSSSVFPNRETINYTNANNGSISVFSHRETISTNNLHPKAIRSSSYPLKLPLDSLNEAPNKTRRQSEHAFGSSVSRNMQYNRTRIHSDTACLVPVSDVSVVSLRPGNTRQSLQRTQSYDPRYREFNHKLVKSPSCGLIESEYVTLDQRYILPQHSQLNRVTECSDLTAVQPSSCITMWPNNIRRSIDVTQRLTDDAVTKPTSSVTTPYLWPSFNDVHPLYNNSLLFSSKHKLGWANATGTLRSNTDFYREVNTGVERANVLSSTNNYKNRGCFEYSSKGTTRNSGLKHTITGSENGVFGELKRCKSLPDLQNNDNRAVGFHSNYSDDEDGDDFGFLSYPISFSSYCSSAAMNKAKSPSPGSRIFPKRWRSKSKAVPAVTNAVAMWTPGALGSCMWSSVSGRKVQLRPVSILNLSEPERVALQKIALSKLQAMDIGCPVSIPDENSDQRRAKKPLSLKRRSKSVTSCSLDAMGKDGASSGLVFGIPLSKCLVNDRELEKKRSRCAAASVGSPSPMKMRADSSDNLQVPRSPRKSSSSSQGSLDIGSGKHDVFPSHKRAASIDSLPESECSRNTSSSLTDALSLPTSNPASRLNSLAMDGNQPTRHDEAQVPYIVRACFRHIETYGLQTLGIFRVGSSKKRVKQLREEFDSGRDVQLTDEHNPHDVGALLKEYFRDLPDPLLTRELYLPFLHAERMKDDTKKHLALSLLICMLPVANRDTLWALLQFLATVSQHAPDRSSDSGETVAGNKMDTHNLATLFGPNIIHRTKMEKSSDKEMLSESAERVEQSKEIIEVVKDMIDNHHELFEISGNLRDEILRLLIESNQEVADRILRHIANQNQIETDPESVCSVFEDSVSSPVLYHSMNSDANLLAFAQKQTTASHRPLRITKSADDSLDSPLPKSRATLLSESQAISPASKDNHMAMPFNSVPSVHRFSANDSQSSPELNRVPVLRVYPESTVPDVFSGRSDDGNQEHSCSEGFNKNLNIPRLMYFQGSNSSSISSDLSSLNGHGWSENGYSGQWVLPTPPTSRSASPKPLYQSTSSSSTLIASQGSSVLSHPQVLDGTYDHKPLVGSAEWERDRWKHWEKIAAQKKNTDTEQETLV